MKFPFSWLNDFIDIERILQEDSVEVVSEKLTKIGIEVENIDTKKLYDGNVVIGLIEEISPHPTKPNIIVCNINISNNDNKIVVTSDTSVKKGDKIVYCYPGTILERDKQLVDVVEFEGINSYGMLLSLEELGLEDKSDTVWKIESNWQVGSDLISNILPPFMKEEYVLSIKVPSNRADVLSVLGIARELSAIYEIPLRPLPTFRFNEDQFKPDIQIGDDRCFRYVSRILRDVKIKPSDDLIKVRLLLSGQRSINNVVDATNYIMIAIGQPMHAFDYDKLKGGKIVVRGSKEGEKILTLNGAEVSLPRNTLIIADEENPVAIAGVIGGEETAVSDTTTNVLLESAYFDYNTIRKTVREVKISTESSNRFSRDIGFYTTELAINMATHIINANKVSQLTDVKLSKSNSLKETVIRTTFSTINSRIGYNIPEDRIKTILSFLGFEVQSKGDELTIRIPAFRKDISIEEDIIEEVARIYGYDNIPSTLPRIEKNPGLPSNELKYEEIIRNNLVSQGLTEVMNFSFISEKDLATYKIPFSNVITISNPMIEEDNIIKPFLLINLLKTIKRNINNGYKNLSLFEIGKVFKSESDKFVEEKNICIALHGNKYDNWAGNVKFSYYDLKDIVDRLFAFLGVRFDIVNSSYTFLHNYVSGKLVVEGEEIGYIGKVHPEITQKLEVDDAFVCEFSLTRVEKYLGKNINYSEINRLPFSTKNISVIVPKNYYTRDLVEFVRNYDTNDKNLGVVDVRIVDVYEGGNIPEGMKSVNILIKLQWINKVGSEAEIKSVFMSIIRDIQEKLGFVVRGV
ncbi:MAG: phenylalanine--tRNA ligase subunit beta [Brevinematales bacterium]|nr:phenylalanine--tRNA ligase subunit beta [Brevinematales bacterium]